MKVISGKLKGRKIIGYDIFGTRPTMDRVKESVFSMIQNNLSKAIVLDLFAGSGNLGIEALSNGAEKTYFNDKNIKCIKAIKDNLLNMNIMDNSVLLNMDYLEALNYLSKKNIKFDLVFLDPPYKEKIMEKILDIMIKKDLLKSNGLVICEMTESFIYQSEELSLYKERNYGDKKVYIYQKNN